MSEFIVRSELIARIREGLFPQDAIAMCRHCDPLPSGLPWVNACHFHRGYLDAIEMVEAAPDAWPLGETSE